MTACATWSWHGASVRGPAHIALGVPNQDAWAAKRVRGASVATVCDGLGSRQHSDLGSREACRAVVAATRAWAQRPAAPVELLLRLIHDHWLVGIWPHPKESCATTCLLTVACEDGRLVAARLGDGLAAIDSAQNGFCCVGEDRGDGFANETTGLGIATALSEWQWTEITNCGAGYRALLATDGIADDLLPERQAEFLRFAYDTYCTVPRGLGRGRLVRDLRAWPVPLHGDDKTIVLFWGDSEATEP